MNDHFFYMNNQILVNPADAGYQIIDCKFCSEHTDEDLYDAHYLKSILIRLHSMKPKDER